MYRNFSESLPGGFAHFSRKIPGADTGAQCGLTKEHLEKQVVTAKSGNGYIPGSKCCIKKFLLAKHGKHVCSRQECFDKNPFPQCLDL